MNTLNRYTARLLMLTVAATLCGTPVLQAQTAAGPAATQDAQQNQPPTPGGMVDPARGPLQPIPPSTTLPEAPAAQQQKPAAEPPREPLGTAVGQQGVTSGGPASTPAGAAIAPAKQRQYRSLLIRIGAIAAAGAAVGLIVGLTSSSPSKPPGAK